LKPGWSTNVIVENRPGGGGRLAIDTTRSADPDGLTLLNTPTSILTILPHAYRTAPFDPLKDLLPVGGMTELDFGFVVGPMAPARTVAEYLDLCRKDNKLASYGTAGAGSTPHLMGFSFARESGVPLVHVAYRGGGPAFQDVLGGQIASAFGALSPPMVQAHKEGKVRILATTGTKRSSFVDGVPTMIEAGFKSVVATDWSGLLAPAGTPAGVIHQISALVQDAVRDPGFRTAVARLNMEPLPIGPEEYAKRLAAEYAQMGPLVKAAGFTLEG
jgi:tripartite-type tricarboxylate transporter receptor subunit TctC